MVTESGWPGSGAHLAALLAGHCAALLYRNLLTLLRSVRNLRSGWKYCKSFNIRMLCGSPSCTDAQHSLLERTGSSGWAHCDKSPQAPVNKRFKLGIQASNKGSNKALCFPQFYSQICSKHRRLIRRSPPELVGTISMSASLTSFSGCLAPRALASSTAWRMPTGLLLPLFLPLLLCLAPPEQTLLYVVLHLGGNICQSQIQVTLAMTIINNDNDACAPVYLFCWVISVTCSHTSLTGVEHLSS